MNERLDYLVSIAIDDELDPAEREELDRLLADHPEAADRRASFESINALVQSIGAQPVNSESGLDAGLDAVRTRIEDANAASGDELSRRRRRISNWIPSLGLAAAAAMAVYFVIPQNLPTPNGSSGSMGNVVDSESSRSSSEVPTSEAARRADDPIALAVVFELDEDAESAPFIDSMSADDFEIIEQLELLEFLAARETEGRG